MARVRFGLTGSQPPQRRLADAGVSSTWPSCTA